MSFIRPQRSGSSIIAWRVFPPNGGDKFRSFTRIVDAANHVVLVNNQEEIGPFMVGASSHGPGRMPTRGHNKKGAGRKRRKLSNIAIYNEARQQQKEDQRSEVDREDPSTWIIGLREGDVVTQIDRTYLKHTRNRPDGMKVEKNGVIVTEEARPVKRRKAKNWGHRPIRGDRRDNRREEALVSAQV